MSTTLLIQKSKHENSETLYKASTLQQIWTLLLSPLFVPLSFVFTWLSRESTAASNPFLQENYAPIDHESDSVPAKVVQGQIPSDLNGVFARIGPNPRATTNGDYHWFDGNGMIHGVKIGNQSASLLYHSNQLKIPRQLEQDRIGLVVYFQIGWLMGSSPLAFLGKMVWGALLKAVGYAKSFPALHLGQANTALEVYEGKLLATHEASLPFHIAVDKEDGSFESMGYHDFEGTLQHAMTAHPKVDKETGEMIFFGYSFDNEKAFCSYSVIKDGVVKCTMELSRDDLLAGYPKMMHDFAITPNYSILLDLPLIFDVKLAMRAKMPIVFQKDLPARVAVFNRYPSGTHSIKWFHITSCAIFHTFGAWEERNSVGDLIIGLAACRLPDFSMKIRKVGGFTRPYLYKFNLTTGETVEERCIFSTLEGHDFSIDFRKSFGCKLLNLTFSILIL